MKLAVLGRTRLGVTGVAASVRVHGGSVDQWTLVRARATAPVVVTDADHDVAGAARAATVIGAERDVVHAAVALTAALGAHTRRRRADARGIGAGVAVARARQRLVLGDGVDRDGDGIAIRIGHALDGYGGELVVRRPEGGDAWGRQVAHPRAALDLAGCRAPVPGDHVAVVSGLRPGLDPARA